MRTRTFGRSVLSVLAPLALIVTLGAGTATPAPATSPTPGDAVFNAARIARTGSAYPHYATYVTVVRYRLGAAPGVRSWETIEDEHRRLVHSRAISLQEQAHPTYPHGINIGVGLSDLSSGSSVAPGATKPQGDPAGQAVLNPETTDDPIGQLTLAVDQDFGLALNLPAITATDNAGDVASSKTALPIIGRTGAIARIYDVTVLDDVHEGAATLHHLSLKPIRDPGKNRLRELWIDAKTSLPVRAVVHGIGNRGPLDSVSWRVDFRQIGDGTYIAQETALAPLDTGSGLLENVTITFEQVNATNNLLPYQGLGFSETIGITDP